MQWTPAINAAAGMIVGGIIVVGIVGGLWLAIKGQQPSDTRLGAYIAGSSSLLGICVLWMAL